VFAWALTHFSGVRSLSQPAFEQVNVVVLASRSSRRAAKRAVACSVLLAIETLSDVRGKSYGSASQTRAALARQN
jgi:hypothetical protein